MKEPRFLTVRRLTPGGSALCPAPADSDKLRAHALACETDKIDARVLLEGP
jgi:hypothetical protein